MRGEKGKEMLQGGGGQGEEGAKRRGMGEEKGRRDGEEGERDKGKKEGGGKATEGWRKGGS